MVKLTRAEMRTRLMDLAEGDVIEWTEPGRTEAKRFTVLGIFREEEKALCATRVGLLGIAGN